MTEAAPWAELAESALSLARSFAAGATMWCVSFEWPWHARHLAVEFVHPVIVGKRALPAVYVAESDAVTALRSLARPGDVVAVVGRGSDDRVADLLRQAETWGLGRLWIGVGSGAPPEAVQHAVQLTGVDTDLAARGGDLVLLYHVLWELTHVVFEHPGLLETRSGPCGPVCQTCADEATPVEILRLMADHEAEVILDGVRQAVDVSLLDDPKPGDLVLVHAGVAIAEQPVGEPT